MSFMTERYFQLLETHRIYDRLHDEASLRLFVEHHVICVWIYNYLMRDLYQEIANHIQPMSSQVQKEAIRLISELVLEEEVDEQNDGTLISHMEIYLEAMQDLGADVGPIMSFFDLLESGKDWVEAARQAHFPIESQLYFEKINVFFESPVHERAALLFYEGEPYVPDSFLNKLNVLSQTAKTARLLEYFEKHIEGLKRPGFSAIGRLVELFCGDDEDLNAAAEARAEEAMKIRLEFWGQIAGKLSDKDSSSSRLQRSNLRLITNAV